MSKRRLKNRKLLTEINVIPYVDISLVLLVIFMVATPFMIQGIDLDLPKTEAQALNKSKEDNLTISISKEGFYSLDFGEKNEMYKSFQSFGEQFEKIILEIQTKHSEPKNLIDPEIDLQKQRLELLERNNLDQEKEDMWKDEDYLKNKLYYSKIIYEFF